MSRVFRVCAERSRAILLDHYFVGLDTVVMVSPLSELELALRQVMALSRRLAPTRIATWAIDIAQLNFFDFAAQLFLAEIGKPSL